MVVCNHPKHRTNWRSFHRGLAASAPYLGAAWAIIRALLGSIVDSAALNTFGNRKREGARREILEGAKSLPLSEHGKGLLAVRLPRIASELFHNASNQVEAAGRLSEALSGFGAKDREVLKGYFESARAGSGFGLLETWKHKGTLKRGEIRIDD